MIISLTINAPTQKAFFRTLPESPLPSQKQAKLVLSAKVRDCKPHKKHPYTKGLFSILTRIAASITKTSRACFYPQSLFYRLKACFYPPKPAPHQNRRFNHKNKRSLFLSTKALFLPMKPVFIHQSLFLPIKDRFSPESPLPSQKQAKLVLSTEACFYPQTLAYFNEERGRSC